MTISTIPFRDLQRGMIPTDNIVHLVDKKSGKSKGLFIPPILENDILELLKESEKSKKQKKIEAIEAISGLMTGITEGMSFKELKASYVENKYGK